jgi:heterodisulfide reductase subunit A-like polyferredoxin
MSQTTNKTGAVLVAGGGIAGIQAALDLADSGYLVYLAEDKPAIGGVMAQLDKTFPTNDCAMCVISPKLVECGRHLNIELLTLSQIANIEGEAGNFTVTIKERSRFIDPAKCTSCGECAKACPIEMPNLFDMGLRNRNAAYKLYPQGMPSAYAIEKRGAAPCKAACPAHVSIQGYIALMNQGRHDEALALFKDEHPFPGVCGRVCHHPCEKECTRGGVDESLAIRELHRFLADLDGKKETPHVPKKAEPRPEKIAVAGSGPAGLTAAAFLARRGYPVTVFEKLPEPGGMMRVGIPEYRLPREVLAKEIRTVRDLGVEIRCGVDFGKDVTLESLKADGYKAVFLGVGLHGGRKLGVQGEDAPGVVQSVDFLRDAALGKNPPVGDSVVVVGGGNVAIDAALTAKRLGAGKVTLVCLEKREEMPAWEHEIEEAIEGDVEIVNSFGPKCFSISGESVSGLEFRRCTSVFDSECRFNPEYDDADCRVFPADTVILAIGQSAVLDFAKSQGVSVTARGGLAADPVTLQTPLEWVFAGGDAFYGPKSVVEAVACGKEAAESIHRFVNGLDLREGREKTWEYVRPDTSQEPKKPRTRVRCLDPEARECNFLEVSYGYDAEEARAEASRCLKCGICSECYRCVDACLAGAVDHTMEGRARQIQVGSVILAPGFSPYDPSGHDNYAYTTSPNVVTSLEFERILSASGPYQGHLVRPSDHKEPEKIAWIQCVGSRDENKAGHAYCSSVCCMYANKQAVIAKEHSPKPLDTAIFYMDMRTFGKDFDKYTARAAAEHKVRHERARIHTVVPLPDGSLSLRYATEEGKVTEETFDMVVLSIGLAPARDAARIAETLGIGLNRHGFAKTLDTEPVLTDREGVFVCGAFQGPKDIPQSVMEASAAAAEAARSLSESRFRLTRVRDLPPERDVLNEEPRVGVFVCNCGINIGGVADVPAVREYARSLPNVVHVEDNLFTCSQDTQDRMKGVIQEHGINRVVVASCSPRTHEPLFQETIRDAGLNPYLFEMANIRDQNTWVHMNDPKAATEKAKDLVRMAVAKAAFIKPLHQVDLPVARAALVAGGGVAGMEAALCIADQGVPVHLVEREAVLGGMARNLSVTWQGEDIQEYLARLAGRVQNHPNIRVYLNTEVVETKGSIGHFRTVLIQAGEDGRTSTFPVEHGAAVLATGGHEYQPKEYLHGEHPGVMTHLAYDKAVKDGDARVKNAKSAAFIQCVGSRIPERPYCSKVCCAHSLKSAIALMEEDPERSVYILYRDLRSYGFREDLYANARKLGVQFIRYELDHLPAVEAKGEGLSVSAFDPLLGARLVMDVDLLVLASAVLPNANKDLFEAFKVPVNADGFLVEAHAKLRPVDFASEGLFLAGLAHGPKPVDESIAQGRAAAARAMCILSKESIRVGGVVADLEDPDRCARCLVCVRSCPYSVPRVREGRAWIDPAQCHGCGICASECPAKVITLRHFTDSQILAKEHALFEA